MTPDGRRCCERYDALMEKMPAYEAAVEAARALSENVGADDYDRGWLAVPRDLMDEMREALRRLQEQTQ